MKVIIAVILAVSSTSAIRSGPYLPSGWRPQGPPFYLPSEVQKPAENPLKEIILIESEASGSEGLLEYGPPEAVVKESVNVVQALPDSGSEKTFNEVDNSVVKTQVEEANVEQKAEIVQEVATKTEVAETDEIKTQDFERVEFKPNYYETVTDKVEAEIVGRLELNSASYEVVTDKVDVDVAERAELKTVSYETDKVEDVAEQVELKTASYEAVTDKIEENVAERVELKTDFTGKVEEDVVEREELNTATFEGVADKVEEHVAEPLELKTASYEAVTDKVEVEVVTDKAEVVDFVSEVKKVETTIEEKLENILVQEEKLKNIVIQEENVEKVVVETIGEVKDIAEALVNIGNEVQTEQVQSVEAVSEVTLTQDESGSELVREGFLEYGPPGFKEYGPPKGDALLRNFENNETRSRRFSPKFRSSLGH